MSQTASTQGPAGVTVTERDGEVTFTARAGKVDARLMAAFLLAAIWTGKWALDAAVLVKEFDRSPNPGVEMAVFLLMSLAGLYVMLLLLWSMLGHERVTVRGGRLLVGNPWFFGIPRRAYDLRRIEAFQCGGQDCAAQEEGCCCRFSTVDYVLVFTCGRDRVSLFPHLPREAKDWLRERLNALLSEQRPR